VFPSSGLQLQLVFKGKEKGAGRLLAIGLRFRNAMLDWRERFVLVPCMQVLDTLKPLYPFLRRSQHTSTEKHSGGS
jgi:hypothetical protein